MPCHAVPYCTPCHRRRRTIPCSIQAYRTASHTLYHNIPYHTAPHSTAQDRTTPHHAIPYHIISYHIIPYPPCHAIPYRAVLYSSELYCTMPYAYHITRNHTIAYNTMRTKYGAHEIRPVPTHLVPSHPISSHHVPCPILSTPSLPYLTPSHPHLDRSQPIPSRQEGVVVSLRCRLHHSS